MDRFFVYILYSESIDKYYIGQTSDVDQRLLFHNDRGRNKIWTKRGIPWELKCHIPFDSRSNAMKAENFIKKQKSRKLIEGIIKNGWKSI